MAPPGPKDAPLELREANAPPARSEIARALAHRPSDRKVCRKGIHCGSARRSIGAALGQACTRDKNGRTIAVACRLDRTLAERQFLNLGDVDR
jgi:hypothetical protein